ncbi:unnamed protein product [Microthlaspi erraticum]|uniref:Uncharacterized protein n=1 Tax=Microthlaspi erraticum TaxID=1685480 RepID=A0A6D2IAI2_9BRAS|nr:unnamed protein product [Microthlaspi erraticum]
MDTKTATKIEAAPAVVKAMEELMEMHRKDVTGKEQSVVTMEMIKGLSDRMQRIEEKLDSLISSRLSNPAAFKTGPVNSNPFSIPPFPQPQIHAGKTVGTDAKAGGTSFESIPFDEEMENVSALNPFEGSSGSVSGPGGPPFSPSSGRGRGLYTGGRFGGGRCGGQGFCSFC